jgi:hypothetical protein
MKNIGEVCVVSNKQLLKNIVVELNQTLQDMFLRLFWNKVLLFFKCRTLIRQY